MICSSRNRFAVHAAALASMLLAAVPLDAIAQAVPAQRFGIVWRLQGEVIATPAAGGAARALRLNDPVFVGDRVRSGAAGEAVLRTEDAGVVAIRPGAEFISERYSAEGRGADYQTLRLITGALRVVSGWIGRTNPQQNFISTTTITIGVRGTDHEPYVLSGEMAARSGEREGTYDKVNSGAAALGTGAQALVVPAGRVGFAPAQPPKEGLRTRGMLTLLLPFLLEKVPGFYVPGAFDAEIERYSRDSQATIQDELNKKRASEPSTQSETTAARPSVTPVEATTSAAASPQAAPPSVTPPETSTAAAATPQAAPRTVPPPGCSPDAIGRDWLAKFDAALARRNAAAVLALFARDVTIRANVRGVDGRVAQITLTREEMVSSAVASMAQVTDFQQRRISIDAQLDASSDGACRRVNVSSVVIEQGRRAGQPYRFESLEEFQLARRGRAWLAVRSETTQR